MAIFVRTCYVDDLWEALTQGILKVLFLAFFHLNDLLYLSECTEVCKFADDTTFCACDKDHSSLINSVEHDSHIRYVEHDSHISWCGNFVERQSFRVVLDNLPETIRKLCFSAKFPHQEIR